MPGRECYHCKQWIEDGEEHDCWTTTEAALTQGLSDDLRSTVRLGAAARDCCFLRRSADLRLAQIDHVLAQVLLLLRPKKNFLELCVFLARRLKAPQVRRVDRASKSKVYHIIHIKHRDEVEAPITDWLREAYERSDALASNGGKMRAKSGERP
jgi:Domain of unknown function (DUF5655)